MYSSILYSDNLKMIYQLTDFDQYRKNLQSYIKMIVPFDSGFFVILDNHNTIRSSFPSNNHSELALNFPKLFTAVRENILHSNTASKVFRISTTQSAESFQSKELIALLFKHNISSVLYLNIDINQTSKGSLLLTRSEQNGDFSDLECRKLQSLLPHIQTSFSNQYHYHILIREKDLIAQASSIKGKGIFILDQHFCIIFYNSTAFRLIPNLSETHYHFLRELCSPFKHKEGILTTSALTCSLDLADRSTPFQVKRITDPYSDYTYYWCEFSGEDSRLSQIKKNIFTPKEQTILEHVLTGKSNKSIASTLGISPETVKSHLRNIYHKYGVHSRTELLSKIYLDTY